MDGGNSTIRNLLWFVLVLVVVSILSNLYVASQLARNSNELAGLRLILQKELMGEALTQSEELQKRMDALNQTAGGINDQMKQAENEMDAKMQKAQDDFVARMQVELPKIMDNYIKQRTPMLEQQAERQAEKQLKQRGVPLPH